MRLSPSTSSRFGPRYRLAPRCIANVAEALLQWARVPPQLPLRVPNQVELSFAVRARQLLLRAVRCCFLPDLLAVLPEDPVFSQPVHLALLRAEIGRGGQQE